jgi:hypothetical protein
MVIHRPKISGENGTLKPKLHCVVSIKTDFEIQGMNVDSGFGWVGISIDVIF